MFDINKILKKKKSNKKFTDTKMSDIFGENIISNSIGKLTDKPLKNMGASVKKQNQWKNFSYQKRNKMRRKHKDTDGDRVPDMWDCSPLNIMKQDIRFGRKPKNMDKSDWEKQKETITKTTDKYNTSLDPRIKMNTILRHDYEIKKLKQVNSIFQDEEWQEKINEESKNALKQQGYTDEDVTEYLANKNKLKQDTANYFTQELAKTESVGHLFKGGIPQKPISHEEGKRRYEEFDKSNKYISGIGQVQKNIKSRNLYKEEYNEDKEEEDEKDNKYSQPVNTKNVKDRDEIFDLITDKEIEGEKLTSEEKEFQRYHELIDEDFTELTKQEQDFLKEYRYKQDYDDLFENENQVYDSELDFYKWKDKK